jgi:tetratricopeptide (TPR) repeat protein
MPNQRAILDDAIRYQRGGVLDRALDGYRHVAARARDAAIVSEALRRAASVHRVRCEWERALDAARRSRSVAAAAGRSDLAAEALNAEAIVHRSRGEWDAAIDLLKRVLEETEDPRIRGLALQNLGSIHAERGDMNAAETHFMDSYRCFCEAGYEQGQATALLNYGRAALDRGDRELAAKICREALRATKSIEDLSLVALARLNYAEALAKLGERAEALDLASAALGFFITIDDRWRQVEALRLVGDLHQPDDRASAERCYRKALRLAREIDARTELPHLESRLGGGKDRAAPRVPADMDRS